MIRNLQRIQIKVATDSPPGLNLNPFLEIFGRWRKEKDDPAEWVDVADYAHIPRGPGIVLIGQRCNFSFDLAPPGPGILYTAKKGLSGTHEEKILTAFQWCLDLTNRLASEEEFPNDVKLRTDSFEIRFNDRLETPNNSSTDQELRLPLRSVLDILFGQHSCDLSPQTDPVQCYGFSLVAKRAEPLEVLLGRLTERASI